MKLSTINWLSRAIVLPLFIVTASIAPAGAEQMARSRRIESLPSVKNLNLSIPVPAVSIDSTESQESMSVTPYWSNSRSSNSSPKVVKERDLKSKPISKSKRKLSATPNESIDPSFNKRNGYDGTSGCIGITSLLERNAINNFVTKHQPRSLVVSIITPSGRQ